MLCPWPRLASVTTPTHPVTMPTSSASQHFTLPSLHKLISRGGRGLSQSITSVTVSTVVMGASCPRRVFTWAQRTQVYSSRVSYNPGKGGHLRTGRPPPLLRAIEVSHAQHVIQGTVSVPMSILCASSVGRRNASDGHSSHHSHVWLVLPTL